MIYGASDLARRLLDRSDDQVRDVFLRDLAAIFPELPGMVKEMEVQRWPEGIPFSAPGRHRWQPVLEQPVGRVHLAGDYLGARGGMDTAAVSGYEAALRITSMGAPAGLCPAGPRSYRRLALRDRAGPRPGRHRRPESAGGVRAVRAAHGLRRPSGLASWSGAEDLGVVIYSARKWARLPWPGI
jgi:hypothetical protein